MAQTQGTERQTIPFFGLPRELRDMVYDDDALLEFDEHKEHTLVADELFPNCHSATMTSVELRTNLLLVSHQFGSEYRQRCESRCKLRIYALYGHSIQGDNLPTKFLSARSLEVSQQLNCRYKHTAGLSNDDSCFITGRGIDYDCDSLCPRLVSQLPRLQRMNIKILMPPSRKNKVCHDTLITKFGKYKSCPKLDLVQLIVMSTEYLPKDDLDLLQTPSELVAQWRKGEDGLTAVEGGQSD